MAEHKDKADSSEDSGSTKSSSTSSNEKKEAISIHQLFRYADKRDAIMIFLAILCSTAVGALQPAAIIIFSNFLGSITSTIAASSTAGGEPVDYIASTLPVILMLVYMAAGITVASYLAQTLWIMTGENQTRRIRMKYLHAILRQDMTWYDQSKEGSLTTRLTSDTQLIQDGISEKFGIFVASVAQFISGIIVGFTGDWLLSLVILSTFPILGAAATVMGLLVSRFTTKAQDAYADAGKVAEQAFYGIRTVCSFSMEKRFATRYYNELEKARAAGFQRAIVFGLGTGGFLFTFFGTYALSFYYGSTLVIKGHIDGPKVIIVFFGIILGAVGLMTLPQNLAAITNACGAAHTIFATIERVPTIDPDDKQGRNLPPSWKGDIELRNVSFSYPTRSDIPILQHIDLSIPSSSTVALVGHSGSGKSTIVQLLQRLYDPTEGSVLLDGNDIKSFDVCWIRDQIGLVSQEPSLFAMTIKENILLGASDPSKITMSDVEKACKDANCHDFITKLPQGYDTLVGQSGALLSGGQKQRIAIARALISSPKILLLDEATSALDTQSERLVQQALDTATTNRTTILIAHRLSTIKNADCIVVLDKGHVVEQGTHEELVALEGMYAELVKKQTITSGQTFSENNSIDGDNSEANPTTGQNGSNKQEIPTVEDLIEQEKIAIQMDIDKKASISRKRQGSIVSALDDDLKKSSHQQQQEEENKDNQGKAPVLRVVKQMKSEWHLLLLGTFGSLIAACVFPSFGYVFAQVVVLITMQGGLVSTGPMQGANFYAFLLMIVGVGSLVGFGLKIVCFEFAGERYTKRLRHDVFKALLRQEMGYYDASDNSTGVLTTKLAVEAKNVNEMITKVWGEIIQTTITGVAGLVIAFVFSWQLTLVLLGISPLLVVGSLYEAKVEEGFGDITKTANEECGQVAAESIKEIRTVASLNKQGYFEQRFFDATELPHRMTRKKAWMASVGYACTQGIPLFAQAIAFYAGMRFIANGWITYNQMFTSIMMTLITAMGVGSGLVFAKSFAKGKASAVDIFQIIDRQPAIDPDLEGIEPASDTIRGDIKFQDVKFAYPTREDHFVFDGNLNIQVDALKKVALVGPSGCGKSTTISLLERFYDPESGSIRLDDQNTTSYTLGNLRSHMAMVGQEPVLFDLTLRENIMLGVPEVKQTTEEEMKNVCKMANVHDFIMSLPDGYDTQVGDKGSQLSGGQKQRIAIGRSLVRKPKVLLLDEATSALDSESEKLVQEALDQVLEQGGRTTITIAHRLSTIQNSDLICVIENGHVKESGTHAQLLALDGLYAKLVIDQSLKIL